MSSLVQYTDKGWYYFRVTEAVQDMFEKKRRYAVRPTEQSTAGEYRVSKQCDNKKVKNPHFGANESYHHDVPRYGWLDSEESVWVSSCHDIESELFHWDIFRIDGTIGLCFADKPLVASENASCPVIILRDITMYSPNDERVFLEWLFDIDCIERISGVGSELRLHMVSNDIFASDLDELTGVFKRYQLDQRLLECFGKY